MRLESASSAMLIFGVGFVLGCHFGTHFLTGCVVIFMVVALIDEIKPRK
jgi:hypothetical protein